jgi:hypothetical protein
MAIESLTGNDSIVINDRALVDFADGDAIALTYPNEIADLKTGKNKNGIYADNQSGFISEVTMRILIGSSDDKWLQARITTQEADFPSTVLMNGQFVKRVGDGAGNITRVTYKLRGGIFTKRVEAKSNTEADTEQSVAIYTAKFRDGSRIQE